MSKRLWFLSVIGLLTAAVAAYGEGGRLASWYAQLTSKGQGADARRAEGDPHGHQGHATPKMPGMGVQTPEAGMGAPPEMPPGSVMVSPMRQQQTGVRTEPVEEQSLQLTLRTVGMVDFDERKVAHIHTKIEGWIEEIFVNFTGQVVKKGNPLFSIYSPDLVATQTEYLLALRGKRYLEKSPIGEVAASGDALLEAARRRLQLWDISERQIAELERTGTPKKTLTIYSPISGIVVQKEAYKGRYIKPEMAVYTVADLSSIWVNADIYEYEAPFVRVGQEATITLPYFPGEAFRGQLIYIYPYLKEKTRTLRARFELRNSKDFQLKPEMFTNVDLKIDVGRRLAVPEEAVIDTGTRQVVFVDQGDGMFEPRDVKLGAKVNEYYEVLAGLSTGERVVTSANFLIDSESRLKAAMGGMGGMHGMDMGKKK